MKIEKGYLKPKERERERERERESDGSFAKSLSLQGSSLSESVVYTHVPKGSLLP